MDIEEMMQEYTREVDSDTEIDELNVKEKSAKVASVRQKWVHRLNKMRWKVHSLQVQKSELIEEKMGNSKLPPTVSKAVKQQFNESSEDIRELNKQIGEYSLLVGFLEETCKNIANLGWDIRNYVELLKMETL